MLLEWIQKNIVGIATASINVLTLVVNLIFTLLPSSKRRKVDKIESSIQKIQELLIGGNPVSTPILAQHTEKVSELLKFFGKKYFKASRFFLEIGVNEKIEEYLISDEKRKEELLLNPEVKAEYDRILEAIKNLNALIAKY